MNCPRCGTQNIEGVTFCGACGAQMGPLPELSSIGGAASSVAPPPLPPSPPSASTGGQQQQRSSTTYTHSTSVGRSSFSPPQGGASNGGMVMPKNYMVESIINAVVSFFCCGSVVSAILAVIAIVKANSVTTSFNAGRYDEAIRNADSARTLNIWAVVIDVIWLLIIIVLYVFMGLAIFGAFMGFR